MLPYPHWVDDAGLMAKSADMGGQTLVQHTLDVLQRLGDMHRLHQHLANHTHDRLWEHLYWGCLLHDFGKAARDFQLLLQGQKTDWSDYGQRHEVLSLGFVDWLFPRGHTDREPVISVIACHHRDLSYLLSLYGGEKSMWALSAATQESAKKLLNHLDEQIDLEIRGVLWRWLHECGSHWANHLGIGLTILPTLIPREEASQTKFSKAIFNALRDLVEWRKAFSPEQTRLAALYRGLILTSDHAASAGVSGFPALPLTPDMALKPLVNKNMRQHQEQAKHVPLGSALLIAPTGSGKTEAALLWAATQLRLRPAARLFYTLPYQASMNAMELRLRERFFGDETDDAKNIVSIQHSRATLKFFQEMMDSDGGANPRAIVAQAQQRKNQGDLNVFPVRVFSPYQMLKAAFRLKGYEALLVDYTDALFIFDEIHAYDTKRLAQIITFMGWLRQHFGARFLVMTATLPPTVEIALKEALAIADNTPHIIQADKTVFDESQRHIVQFVDGDVTNFVQDILEQYHAGQCVLVVCNQVARAQQVYGSLKQLMYLHDKPSPDLLLLHGRFNGKDRAEKEQKLAERVGVEARRRGKPRPPFVLVATQVVEVSLDVDFDVLYTDPAPLEALLQRFGRVNRGRTEQQLCPVYVFREPSDEKGLLPYKDSLVQRGLAILEAACGGKAIDEAKVNDMLAEIYTGAIADEWWRDYKGMQAGFESQLREMKPYESADEQLFHKFYEMFDGYQVLPADLQNDYVDLAEKQGYLAASQYLVNITSGQYHQIRNNGLMLERPEKYFFDIVKVPYSSEHGLDIQAALQAKHEKFADEDV